MQPEVVDDKAERARRPRTGMPSIRCRAQTALAGRRIARFLLVGCVAATLHWTLVVVLVERAGWLPLVANLGGWLAALAVSFFGHHRCTFRGHRARLSVAARRFVLVSATGFAVNESAYALLLRASALRFDLLLAGVLAAVALATYLWSQHWVFLRSSGR
jgi:putative flippase GtrA